MALPAKILRFEIEVSDVDAGFYEPLSLRVAQHPSETDAYLLTRVIARCLHAGDGVEFSKAGLSDAEEPALIARDLTGRITLWLEVGSPAPERLHKASKAADQVVVYTQKRPDLLLAKLRGATIHRAEDLRLVALDPKVLDQLAGSIARLNSWTLMRSDGVLYITTGDLSVSLSVEPIGRLGERSL
jgi:uncharacterized protein YaeQ